MSNNQMRKKVTFLDQLPIKEEKNKYLEKPSSCPTAPTMCETELLKTMGLNLIQEVPAELP